MVNERLRTARAALMEPAVQGLAPDGRLFLEGLIDYLRERKL
jgi:hypothetical protein